MSFESTLQSLLNCVCTSIGSAGWTGDCCLVPGTPSFDTCCGPQGENTGMAWARVVDVTRDELALPPVDPSLDPSWRMQVEIGATVCVCFDLCSCEIRAANATRVLTVAEAALQGLACCFADELCNGDLTIVSLTTIDPEGDGCGGFKILATVGYALCCLPAS